MRRGWPSGKGAVMSVTRLGVTILAMKPIATFFRARYVVVLAKNSAVALDGRVEDSYTLSGEIGSDKPCAAAGGDLCARYRVYKATTGRVCLLCCVVPSCSSWVAQFCMPGPLLPPVGMWM